MSYNIRLDADFSEYSVDLQYNFELIQNIADGRDRSFTTITLQDPSDSRHFGFEPGGENPTIEWLIYDDGTDKSDGTLSSSSISDSRFSNDTVVTVEEQIIWLTEYIHDNTSDARWLLEGGRFSDPDGDGTVEGTNVVIQSIPITQVADRQQAANAKINLKLGVTV